MRLAFRPYRVRFSLLLLTVAASLLLTAQAHADLVTLGNGPNKATAVVNFSDGYAVQFDYFFSESSLTGTSLLKKIDNDSTAFTTDIQSFSFGDFVNGLTYLDKLGTTHTNSGYGGGSNWWHYWVKDLDTDPWISPEDYGSADRVVTNGTFDGWVYGSERSPVAPTPGAVVPLPASAWMGLSLLTCLVIVRALRSVRRATV
jgi:hypothetical protein